MVIGLFDARGRYRRHLNRLAVIDDERLYVDGGFLIAASIDTKRCDLEIEGRIRLSLRIRDNWLGDRKLIPVFYVERFDFERLELKRKWLELDRFLDVIKALDCYILIDGGSCRRALLAVLKISC
jgi:hypothetical protein